MLGVTINFKKMVLFYNKKTGEIFATIDGRVHDKKHMESFISNGLSEKEIGKYVIGWEETDETEEIEKEVEELVEIKKDLFKKVKKIEKVEVQKKKEHNMDQFELLQKFEDTSGESPLQYRVDIESGKLIKLDKSSK